MRYLLDANVLIDAHRDYYPIDRLPAFWVWLLEKGRRGEIRIPVEIWDEIKYGNDYLAQWCKAGNHQEIMLLEENANQTKVSYVVEQGYANDLTEDEIEKVGRDPFLISYALPAKDNKTQFVTTEVSKPNKTRANRHIPDVCTTLGIKTLNTFDLIKRLDFRSP